MTEKEYEGTPELIFYCEYNPDKFEDRLEIPFTNEYDIKTRFLLGEKNKAHIKIILESKKLILPQDFFGKKVLNVTAIAGKNGVGKTTIFRSIGLLEGNGNKECIVVYLLSSKEAVIEVSSVERMTIDIILDGYSLLHNKGRFFNKLIAFDGVELLFLGQKLSHKMASSFRLGNFVRKQIQYSNFYFYEALTRNNNFRQDFKLQNRNMYIIFPKMEDMTMFLKYKAKIYRWLALNYGQTKIVEEFLFLLYICQCLFEDKSNTFKSALWIKQNEEYVKNGLGLTYKKIIYLFDSDVDFYFTFRSIKSLLLMVDGTISVNNEIIRFNEIIKVLTSSFSKIEPDKLEVKYGFSLRINMSHWQDEIYSLIKNLDMINLKDSKESKTVLYDFGNYSAGEKEILIQTSTILDAIINSNQKNDKFTHIVFLDEYEMFLHPEWMRRYLKSLFGLFDQLKSLSCKIQIIINTHSPYLISDLPKDNVVLLEKDEKTGKRTVRKSNYGFASNYYDIMSDNFFLDDTIGEFAKQKINQVIKRLNKLSNLLDKKESKSKKVSNKFMQQSQLILGHVNPIIELIGDPFIKQQLDRMMMSIDERLKVSCQPESKKKLLEKQRAILEAQIRQIDQELDND